MDEMTTNGADAHRRIAGLNSLRESLPDMLSALGAMTIAESPSSDEDACRRCGDVLEELILTRLDVQSERIQIDGRRHWRWRFGDAFAEQQVLLLGHLDTVWPRGTIDDWPFEVVDDRATGPGVFDMKAGLIQAVWALGTLPSLDGITLLVTSDEEIGSVTSRKLVEDEAARSRAVLVLEAAGGRAVKTSRKGAMVVTVTAGGRAAHAGLDPESGVNAVIELAALLPTISSFARPDAGTSVVPTLFAGGSAVNVVPARAELTVDVRAFVEHEFDRVAQVFGELRPGNPEIRIESTVDRSRPPLERAASEALYRRAQRLWRELGLGDLHEVSVGGASDGNFTAALGVPTLDGLGAVGHGAHARGESIICASMPERAALLAALLDELGA